MTREKVGRIIDYSKDLGLALTISFTENARQQTEFINFNDESFNDTWIDNDDDLVFYDEINKRWIFINIARINWIKIHEKDIF